MLQPDLRADSLAPRPGVLPGRARRIIFLWMSGGPSQMDTFDPKPDINKLAREKKDVTEAPFRFGQHGQSGMWISELLPPHRPARGRPLRHPVPCGARPTPTSTPRPLS